jgi:hypothetical protein
MSQIREFWGRRSWKGKTAIIGGLVVAALLLIGILAPAPDEGGADTVAQATTTVAETTAPATTEEEVEVAKPEDTGRMSENEYDTFRRVQSEVVDESLQFSEEVQACAVIGQTGDLPGFRDCIDEAYSGFEEDAQTAYAVAQDTLNDVDKQCKRALNSYMIVLNDFAEAVSAVHESGRLLQFAELTAASNRLPRQSKRYAKFATNALLACEPT